MIAVALATLGVCPNLLGNYKQFYLKKNFQQYPKRTLKLLSISIQYQIAFLSDILLEHYKHCKQNNKLTNVV